MDLQFGPFHLKLVERELIGPEGPIELSARAFDILALLLARPDGVIRKAELFEAVWPGLVVEDNTLQVHVSALRQVLSDGMIATVHGRGYKYIGPRPVAIEAVGSEKPDVAVEAEPASRPKPSIAVLPFENMSGEPEQSHFSDGITDDIIAKLGKFKEFLVIARSSSFQFRETNRDVPDVARKLGVQYIVQGSMRKIGNRVRVSVELIDALLSFHIWGEHYDRELNDIFAIQDEISHMIATRLARQTRTAIASRAKTRLTDNMSAYECYLKALQLSAHYDYEAICKAEPFLRQSIELDPEFAAGHAMLGFVETLKFFWSTKADSLHSVLMIARTAVRLDPDEAYGHLAAGFALLYLHRFKQAEASLDRAVSLNPNDPFIITVHSLLLHFTARPEMALERLDDAQRRDPFAVEWYWDFRGIALTTCGRYDEAVACYAKLDELTPWSCAYLSVCYAALGETQLAHNTLAKLKSHWPGETLDEIIDHEMDYFEDPAVCARYRTILRRVEAGH
jgi:TolB-like protein